MPEPTDSFHGIIKMKKRMVFVHFLTEKTYVAFKKVMVKIIYLQHAKHFPDEILNILMIKKTLELLSMACPEAARLCLTTDDAMNIFEDNYF